MPEYPKWKQGQFFDLIKNLDPKVVSQITRALNGEFIACHIVGYPMYGDVEACVRAKSIFLTTDKDMCIFHPVNDDEDEMLIRLRYDKVKVLYRRDDD